MNTTQYHFLLFPRISGLLAGLLALLAGGPVARGQIQVTTAGYAENFATRPTGDKWATGSIAGLNTTVTSVATLTPLVQAIDAGTFTTQLPSITGGVGAAATALWNDAGAVTTAPTGVAATLVMARLVNTTGETVKRLDFTWTLGLANYTVDTPEDGIADLMLYTSATGAPNAWTAVNNLNYRGSATTPPAPGYGLSFTQNFPAGWAPGASFNLLWADDNSVANPDGLYYLDNFTVTPRLGRPLQLTATGILATFAGALPEETEWGAGSLTGTSATLTSDLVDADAKINALTLADLQKSIGAVAAATTGTAPAVTDADTVSTAPTGVAATTLLASLINRTGKSLTTLDVEYDLGLANANLATPEDAWVGHRVYQSATGAAGSWVAVGSFGYIGDAAAAPASPQHIVFEVTLAAPLAPDQPLYLLWVDDNSAANPDGLYTLDNVAITPGSSVPPKLEGIQIVLDSDLKRHISVPTLAGFYYVWRRGPTLDAFPDVLGLSNGNDGELEQVDAALVGPRAFYIVQKVPVGNSLDSDGDGMPDVYEMGFPGCLNPAVNDAAGDCDQDGQSNLTEYTNQTNPIVP